MYSGIPPGSPLRPTSSPTLPAAMLDGRTSLPGKLKNSTPYSGPPGLLATGTGKWSSTMNRAVRVVKAFCVLSNCDAVFAR